MIVRGIAVAIAFAGLAAPASAQEDFSWVRRTIRECRYDGCYHRYTWVRRYHLPTIHVQPTYSAGHDCKPTMRAVGEEKGNLDDAKMAAEKSLKEQVRFHHGVKYMDLDNAKSLRYQCAQSSTGRRISERVKEALTGQTTLHQCEVEAIPCSDFKKRPDRD